MAAQKTKPTSKSQTTRPTAKTSSAKKTVRASVKKSTKTSSSVVAPKTSPTKSSSNSSPLASFKKSVNNLPVTRTHIIIAIIVLALIVAFVYFRGFFVVATINGQPIDRLSYMKEVEGIYVSEARTTAGKQAMNQIVTKTLLYQEAAKKNVVVSDKEISDEVAKTRKELEKSGQNLESALTMQGDTLANYQERIKLQKLLEKLIGTVTVTDKEVTDYVAKNKDSIPAGTSEADINTQAKEAVRQEKFNAKVQTLIQSLQKNAKITYSTPQ